ncbi:ommochrome-binding protein-like [Phthorimaea operculella]|nr:ommochrome-binding protein-like [Phthorimaea operculella]
MAADNKREITCDYPYEDNNKHCYTRETILSITHSPNQLTVDKTTNHLYFSFDSGQGEYSAAKVLIGNKRIKILKGIKDAFAMASDPKTGEIYFGGSHGIYRYNSTAMKLRRLNAKNLDIWWLFVKDALYFIKFPSLIAFKYANRTMSYMSQLKGIIVHQFVIDSEGNIFFLNITGLYGIKPGKKEAILIADRPKFLGIATDNTGLVYLCNEDGIYVMAKMIQKIRRILNIQGVLGLTFDRDNNIIYSNSHDIVKLTPVLKETYYKTIK